MQHYINRRPPASEGWSVRATTAEFKQPVFGSPPERLDDLRHLRANYGKHTRAIYLVFGPVGLFEEAKALTSEEGGCGEGEVGAESSIMMTTVHKAFGVVLSMHCKDRRQIKKKQKKHQERLSTCIYQEAGHVPARQASLKYVNVLMLFR